MGKNKLLSVIVPLFNVEEFAERAAKSIASQAFDGLEVVLVDDGSTDNSMGIFASGLQGLDVLAIQQENKGPGGARNTGIRAATGEYIMFLDGDDFLLPGAFENIMAALDEACGPDVLFGRYLRWTPESGFLKGAEYGFEPPEDPEKRTEYICGGLPERSWNVWRYVCRREFVVDKGHFFDTALFCGEDVKWMLALLDSAGSVAYCSEPFYAYYYHRDGSIMNSRSNRRLLDLNAVAIELLQKYSARPGVCRYLAQDTFYSINEYCAFSRADRKQLYDSYKALLPYYRYSGAALHRMVGKFRNPVLFYLLSVLLRMARQGRRASIALRNRGGEEPEAIGEPPVDVILSEAKDLYP